MPRRTFTLADVDRAKFHPSGTVINLQFCPEEQAVYFLKVSDLSRSNVSTAEDHSVDSVKSKIVKKLHVK